MARLGSGIPVWMDRMEVCLEGAVKEAGNPNGAGTGQGGLVGDEPVWLCCVRFPTILSLPHADPHPPISSCGSLKSLPHPTHLWPFPEQTTRELPRLLWPPLKPRSSQDKVSNGGRGSPQRAGLPNRLSKLWVPFGQSGSAGGSWGCGGGEGP